MPGGARAGLLRYSASRVLNLSFVVLLPPCYPGALQRRYGLGTTPSFPFPHYYRRRVLIILTMLQ